MQNFLSLTKEKIGYVLFNKTSNGHPAYQREIFARGNQNQALNFNFSNEHWLNWHLLPHKFKTHYQLKKKKPFNFPYRDRILLKA